MKEPSYGTTYGRTPVSVVKAQWTFVFLLAVLFGMVALCPQSALAEARRARYTSGTRYLAIEFLDDDLVHIELGASSPGPDTSQPICSSPMVFKTDYAGPSQFADDGRGTVETPEVKVEVDSRTLCFTVTDKSKDPNLVLTTICPLNLEQEWKGISITAESSTHVYGLGQQFNTPNSPDGDWVGHVRTSPNEFGNVMEYWNEGAVGNTQIPIAYFLGRNNENYALFIDNPYKQTWDFRDNSWKAEVWGGLLRFFLMAGPDLQDLRKDYVELTGRPPVPPKRMFGLWVSEYGFDGWAELDAKLRTLRENRFPVDGFVLDLQWYGGIQGRSDDTRMGSLTWDQENFPDPEGKIAHLLRAEGVGILLIEQSYIGKNLPEHAQMQERGYLVRECETCGATYLRSNPWWGRGGMIDWTNDAAGAFWHDWKREPLIDLGVIGHWTDLGEPELYDAGSWYWGIRDDGQQRHGHADIHNLYNLRWSQSIYEGYRRNGRVQRPFILSRSGTAGSQRYGVSMWSGDIASNLSSLATHFNAQLHMSLSGIDYFGADIGGFRRESRDTEQDEMYTQWFAAGMALDVPGRVHTLNLCNCNETAPDRIGDLQSNLENVRQRYELSPYVYSLAHRAYLYGEAVFPPLVYFYPGDAEVREMGDEKLLGRDLLVAAVARPRQKERRVYLPAGDWVNYQTHEWFSSSGEWFGPFPLYVGGRFRLPMFARAGAIIPQMYVDGETMNVLGQRLDGSKRDELIVQVFAHETPNSFTLYEDDGQTIAYQQGEVRTTLISQELSGDRANATIGAASGTYAGASAARDNVVKLVVNDFEGASGVTLNGSPLTQCGTEAEFGRANSGWANAGDHLVVAKSGKMAVQEPKNFEFQLVVSAAVIPSQAPFSGEEPSEPGTPTDATHVSLWRWLLTVALLIAVILGSLWAERAYRKRQRGQQ